MKISYSNNRRDLLAFQVHHFWRSPINWLVNAAGLGGLCFFFFQSAENAPLAPRMVATVFSLMIFSPILLAVEIAILMFSVVLRQTGSMEPEQVTVTEDGLLLRSQHSCQNYHWAGIKRIYRTRHRLFIYLLPHLACIVPRRAFEGEREWNDFCELCLRYKKAAGSVPKKPVSVAAGDPIPKSPEPSRSDK
jgi:hypothetical protein